MSRMIRSLFGGFPSAHTAIVANLKIHHLCNRFAGLSNVCSVRCFTACQFARTTRPTKRGFFDFSTLSQERNSGLNNKLIVGGILTLLGLKKTEEPESELVTTIKRGVLLMQNGEIKKSEQMFHIALKIAQEQQNSDAITYIYDMLANLAFHAYELPKAEKLFVSVLQRILSSGVSENDNKVIHISLKLASIYKDQGDMVKAEEGYKFCDRHLQKKIDAGEFDDDTLMLWVLTLNWYARLVLEQGRYKEAFDFFERAYKTSLSFNDVVHEQNVILLNDLGTVCSLQDNYDDALKYLTQAVELARKLPDMKDGASIYVNLGAVYLKRMMLKEARQACKEGWQNAKLTRNIEALEEANICLDEIRETYAKQHKA